MIVPKKNQSWFQKNVWFIVVGLILLGVWWWTVGETALLGGFSNILTPPHHLR